MTESPLQKLGFPGSLGGAVGLTLPQLHGMSFLAPCLPSRGWKGVGGGSLGLLLWVLLLAGILQTPYGVGTGEDGASHLPMTSVGLGILESPELFRHSAFQFY